MTRRDFLAGVAMSVLRSPIMQGPILTPDQPWEGACAMPFSGGIWKTAYGYRCYYLANFTRVCLAVSDDGLHWEKPDLGIVAGTNILLDLPNMDSFSVWHHERRWYMTVSQRSGGPLQLFTSKIGLWWTHEATMPFAGDRTTMWYNPIKARWTFNVRMGGGTGGDPRRIDRVESETFVPTTWAPERWLTAHPQDATDEAALWAGQAQLYAVDVVPDRGRLIGLFTIWRGQEHGRPKLNDVCLGYSANGDTFTREYTPVLTCGEKGSWHWGNVQSVTNGLVRLSASHVRLYASGRDGRDGGNGVCSLGYRDLRL